MYILWVLFSLWVGFIGSSYLKSAGPGGSIYLILNVFCQPAFTLLVSITIFPILLKSNLPMFSIWMWGSLFLLGFAIANMVAATKAMSHPHLFRVYWSLIFIESALYGLLIISLIKESSWHTHFLSHTWISAAAGASTLVIVAIPLALIVPAVYSQTKPIALDDHKIIESTFSIQLIPCGNDWCYEEKLPNGEVLYAKYTEGQFFVTLQTHLHLSYRKRIDPIAAASKWKADFSATLNKNEQGKMISQFTWKIKSPISLIDAKTTWREITNFRRKLIDLNRW